MKPNLKLSQKALLKRIKKVWKGNPSLRFGQLIANIYSWERDEDPYYVEDIDFIKEIERYYTDLG